MRYVQSADQDTVYQAAAWIPGISDQITERSRSINKMKNNSSGAEALFIIKPVAVYQQFTTSEANS